MLTGPCFSCQCFLLKSFYVNVNEMWQTSWIVLALHVIQLLMYIKSLTQVQWFIHRHKQKHYCSSGFGSLLFVLMEHKMSEMFLICHGRNLLELSTPPAASPTHPARRRGPITEPEITADHPAHRMAQPHLRPGKT